MSITKRIVRERNGNYMVITIEARQGHSKLSDGFAITADLYEPRGRKTGEARYRKGHEPDASGAMHDEILKYAPELAPIVAIHLADMSGVPIRAIANGWYFYSGGAREYEMRQVAEGKAWYAEDYEPSDHARAAQALHIPEDDLPTGLDRAGFESFAESLQQRWQNQAAEALAIIESLEDDVSS